MFLSVTIGENPDQVGTAANRPTSDRQSHKALELNADYIPTNAEKPETMQPAC